MKLLTKDITTKDLDLNWMIAFQLVAAIIDGDLSHMKIWRARSLELPITWCEASGYFSKFSAEKCGLFYIEPPNEIGNMRV